MSLAAFAIRVATVRALQAALPSNFVVIDSPVDPFAQLENNPSTPIATVYTGGLKTTHEGREIFGGDPSLDLRIQLFLPETTTLAGLALDTRGRGAEATLDMLYFIISRAFATGTEPWAALWGEFVLTTPEIICSSYDIETMNHVRAAAREIQFKCDIVQEPIPGAVPAGVWADLIALIGADTQTDGLASLAAWLTTELEAPGALSQAERDRIFLGLSLFEFSQIGMGPIASTGSGTAPVMSQGTLDDTDISSPDPDASTTLTAP
jgi:hypothetical protein